MSLVIVALENGASDPMYQSLEFNVFRLTEKGNES
jgi:hypothetical protein